MADVGLDFFQRITDCHWGGGPWFALGFVGPDSSGLTLNFPGDAGGTPGVSISPPESYLKPAPFQLLYPIVSGMPGFTADDLKKKQKTDAGATIQACGVNSTGFHVIENTMFFQCGQGILPAKKKFTISISVSGAGYSLFAGFISPKGKLQPGPFPAAYILPTGSGVSVQIPLIQEGGVLSSTLTVDPTAFTIKWSG